MNKENTEANEQNAKSSTNSAGPRLAKLESINAELLAALAGCADALREAGKDFAQANRLAARPNLYELQEQAARAAIAKARG